MAGASEVAHVEDTQAAQVVESPSSNHLEKTSDGGTPTRTPTQSGGY